MTPIQTQIAELKDIHERRQFLKTLSTAVKPLIAEGTFENVNDAITGAIYSLEGHTTLKTYEQWKSEGKQVKKGEKALFVWGKPKQKDKAEETDEKADKFFPLCYLFSNLQVE